MLCSSFLPYLVIHVWSFQRIKNGTSVDGLWEIAQPFSEKQAQWDTMKFYPEAVGGTGMRLKGRMGRFVPYLENLPFRGTKTVVKCTSAGQLTL